MSRTTARSWAASAAVVAALAPSLIGLAYGGAAVLSIVTLARIVRAERQKDEPPSS